MGRFHTRSLLGAAALLGGAGAATFNPATVVILRVGAGSTALANGTATAVFVDEYDPVGLQVVQSIALSTSLCTLAVGWSTSSWWDAEGLPSLSGDGTLITVGCYKVRPGMGNAAPCTWSGGASKAA
jgi:hypothetical protein